MGWDNLLYLSVVSRVTMSRRSSSAFDLIGVARDSELWSALCKSMNSAV